LVVRPNPLWSVARIAALEARRGFREDEWAELTTLPGLAEKLRNKELGYRKRKT
jgi:hypothetical protein